MITIQYSFLIVAAVITVAVQVAKIFVPENIFKWIPYGILLVSAIVYAIISKDVLTTIGSSLTLTAFSTFFFDIIKPIVEWFKKLIKK